MTIAFADILIKEKNAKKALNADAEWLEIKIEPANESNCIRLPVRIFTDSTPKAYRLKQEAEPVAPQHIWLKFGKYQKLHKFV